MACKDKAENWEVGLGAVIQYTYWMLHHHVHACANPMHVAVIRLITLYIMLLHHVHHDIKHDI